MAIFLSDKKIFFFCKTLPHRAIAALRVDRLRKMSEINKEKTRKRKKSQAELEIEELDRKICDAMNAIPKCIRKDHDKLIKRILDCKMTREQKLQCLLKVPAIGADGTKQIEWFETVLKIPWGQYASIPVNKTNKPAELADFFTKASTTLDEAVYGMETVKEEITNYIAQVLSTDNMSQPRVIALCGSPGVGKTVLVRRGLAEALNRPMKSISMGGIADSSYFIGFDYCYVGSRVGLIATALMETKVMNPVIFMDELDKISNTHSGLEIQNLLVHLTDPVQNNTFADKYLSGLNIDLSRVLFVFSYNDEKAINPILKDRLHIIRVPDPQLDAKIIIGTKYLVNELAENVGFKKGDVIFSPDVMRVIIQNFCKNDKGVRNLKRCIETIMLKCNTARYLGNKQKYKCFKTSPSLPINITEEIARQLLDSNKSDAEEWLSMMFM
jgi:ATP-dependent Lon protease